MLTFVLWSTIVIMGGLLFVLAVVQITMMEKEILGQQLQVYCAQVSGKEPKLLSRDRTKILKGFNATQNHFYLNITAFHLSHPFAALIKHLPRYYGLLELEGEPQITLENSSQQEGSALVWLSHLRGRYRARNQQNRFILLQNLTFGWQQPNVFDIKIGGRNMENKKHKITKTVAQFFLKLNGCRINFTDMPSPLFLSKYYLAGVVEVPRILECLALFFFDGQQLNMGVIGEMKRSLQDLILAFKALRGYHFVSSSVCLIYDARMTGTASVKWLDFGRVSQQGPDFVDEDSLTGLINLHRFMTEVEEWGQSRNDQLKALRQFFSENEVTVVPEKKAIKYNLAGEDSPLRP